MFLHGKSGTSIKLITEYIKSMFNKENPMHAYKSKHKLKPSFKSGILATSDWKSISTGLYILGELADGAFYSLNDSLLAGEQDVSKYKQVLSEYRYVITDLIYRASRPALS